MVPAIMNTNVTRTTANTFKAPISEQFCCDSPDSNIPDFDDSSYFKQPRFLKGNVTTHYFLTCASSLHQLQSVLMFCFELRFFSSFLFFSLFSFSHSFLVVSFVVAQTLTYLIMSALRLGDIAPDFEAETNEGPIRFHDWQGSDWVILFSHPADYTPVCTTELGTVAKYSQQFAQRSVKPIGLSCNDASSHNGWIKDIEEVMETQVHFPIIADADRKVARLYGMLGYQDDLPEDQQPKMPLTVRCVFVIDPSHKIRLILVYPASCGRNFDELIRVIDSLQLTTYQKVTTPANWTPGNKVIVSPAVSNEDAGKLFGDVTIVKPYLRYTPDPNAPIQFLPKEEENSDDDSKEKKDKKKKDKKKKDKKKEKKKDGKKDKKKKKKKK